MEFKRNNELVAHGYAPGDYEVTCADCGQRHISDKRAFRCLGCALSHFAPPRQRMMIEGMRRQEIEAEMYLSMEEKRKRMEGVIYVQECARVAHRLATTPAPEVDADADAGAKAAFQRYQDAKPNGWLRERWHELNEDGKNCWRAVAAMEKGNG